MAKVIADFKIIGTIDDLNFYDTSDTGNLVRIKGKTGITKEQFTANPIFERIRQHGTEFGLCSQKAKVFKTLVQPFYKCSQDGSIFGRCIQLLFAILCEDTQNPIGNRQLCNGLQTQTGLTFLIGFEGNSSRPLKNVLPKKVVFDWDNLALNLTFFNPLSDLIWPELATQVHIQLAVANWNYEEDRFETSYSNVLVFQKQTGRESLSFDLTPPSEKQLWLCFIHFKFGHTLYNKTKLMHNKYNTTTLIGYKNSF
ncbi:hypothetical protein [Flavobacterium aquiphilum]|uniref:hypothetical protein n=1 Tax=Flavobacterium aquiphilum TaxID=3003261 RepID=UPI0024812968|nr:hypothetical protein [Flavobacterium aquiphilum]